MKKLSIGERSKKKQDSHESYKKTGKSDDLSYRIPKNFKQAILHLIWPLNTLIRKSIFWVIILIFLGGFILGVLPNEIKVDIWNSIFNEQKTQLDNGESPPKPIPQKDEITPYPVGKLKENPDHSFSQY